MMPHTPGAPRVTQISVADYLRIQDNIPDPFWQPPDRPAPEQDGSRDHAVLLLLTVGLCVAAGFIGFVAGRMSVILG